MKPVYICQLSKEEQYEIYRKIKAVLLEQGNYSHESIVNAMNSKISDVIVGAEF